MTTPSKSSRREFLQGRAAGRAVLDLAEAFGADASPKDPQAPGPPGGATPAGGADGYLLRIGRRAMACEFEVLLQAGEFDDGSAAAMAALDLVDELEAQLSIYRPDSEVSRLNARAALEPVSVEPGLFALLSRAVQLWRQTDGAFDVTAGPLVKAWGFFQRQAALPAPETLAAAQACTGSQHLQLDATARRVRFGVAGMEINLGAIGKGYALDRAASLLASRGVSRCLLHGGQSSVLARCSAADERGWPIGIRDPLRPERRLAQIQLFNSALGTSGAGVQFFQHQGRRLGHLIDPRTGWPAEGVLSATALSPSAADADALATAFYCQGPQWSAAYCQAHPGVAALLVVPAADGTDVAVMHAGFAPGQLRLAGDEA